MNICYHVFRPDSLTYTTVKALSFCGHDIHLNITDRGYDLNSASSIQQRLIAIPHVSMNVGDRDRMSAGFDHGIIQATPRFPVSVANNNILAKMPRKVCFITAGDRRNGWFDAMKHQRREVLHLGKRLSLVGRIAYKDGCYPVDLYRLLKPRYVVGFDVHSQFLHDEELFKAIHRNDWEPEAKRSILVNFMGSQDPHIRRKVLDSVRPLFREADSKRDTEKSWFWHEYSDSSPAGLDPRDFLDVLRNSDFTMCPQGYSVVTHRPYEALLNGSIPVLNSSELDLYDIGLEHGINCIAVPGHQWPATMEKLADSTEDEIRTMRENIKIMFEKFLDYRASARRMSRRLGVM